MERRRGQAAIPEEIALRLSIVARNPGLAAGRCNLFPLRVEYRVKDGMPSVINTQFGEDKIMDRRTFITLAAGGAGILSLPAVFIPLQAIAAERIGKISKSDAEWKKLLTPAQYDVLRHEGTEAPFSSPLDHEKRSGMFVCVACDLPLFPSKYKFDSGTGWPSFYDVLPGHVETRKDFKLVLPRTEYHCARCGGHHGHVFDDGPRPTGLRYCNNGVALKFIPDKA
ncbi:MAG: peptide-methionine (R)-S-oxide reductase MsrB [Sulfuricella sp.]